MYVYPGVPSKIPLPFIPLPPCLKGKGMGGKGKGQVKNTPGLPLHFPNCFQYLLLMSSIRIASLVTLLLSVTYVLPVSALSTLSYTALGH